MLNKKAGFHVKTGDYVRIELYCPSLLVEKKRDADEGALPNPPLPAVVRKHNRQTNRPKKDHTDRADNLFSRIIGVTFAQYQPITKPIASYP